MDQTVILANGDFPSHPLPLRALQQSARIICCDGAVCKLQRIGLEPVAVVGDFDSLPDAARSSFAGRLVHDPGQDDNDLSKAFRYCLGQGWQSLVILGATGLREDHTLGNVSLLADFAVEADVAMLTDTGIFTPMRASGRLATVAGQPVSIFSMVPQATISSRGLRYPLKELRLTRWWQATLNEATGEGVELSFSGGPLLVYRAYV